MVYQFKSRTQNTNNVFIELLPFVDFKSGSNAIIYNDVDFKPTLFYVDAYVSKRLIETNNKSIFK